MLTQFGEGIGRVIVALSRMADADRLKSLPDRSALKPQIVKSPSTPTPILRRSRAPARQARRRSVSRAIEKVGYIHR